MPGFLSDFAGTVIFDAEALQVVDGERPRWWVELLRNLPHSDHVEADKILAEAMSLDSDTGGSNGRVRMAGSGLVAQQEEVLARSIVRWNLTDENDEPLPVGDISGVADPAKRAAAVAVTRASLGRLPEQLISAMKLVAVTQNQPRRGADAATFPDRSASLGDDARGGQHAAGGAGAELAPEVPDGAGVVAEPGFAADRP
jgi:hypothetical protein